MLDQAMIGGEAVTAVMAGRSSDPFAILGPHGDTVIALLPGAGSVELLGREDGALLAKLDEIQAGGLFAASVPAGTPYRLRIDWNGRIQETEDPYSFGLLLGSLDLHLIAQGRHRALAECLGAHTMRIEDVEGVRFAVWAPSAKRVSVVGDFNGWDGRRHPMRLRHEAGVWELFIPRLKPGALYKYEILGPNWEPLPLKADPIAAQAEPAPKTASVVTDSTPLPWSDGDWLSARAKRQQFDEPLAIYEVHASSWLRPDGNTLDWRGLTERLVPYAAGMGFTHIELLPVMSHPFRGSWGYQPLGQFAPMPEMGPPEDFARLVDRCHAAGLGVILDWVPAHFPNDAHGLARFDGTALYEHGDPREGLHRDWNTLIYNFGRNEVRGFLIASALHWLEHYHADGLRVDAVASMLYRDYSRNAGEWVPNIHGGRENLEAVAFLRELSLAIQERCPGALLIAEESTAWPGVTAPVDDAVPFNLGFTYKWNMGWMHDTLRFMSSDPVFRRYRNDEMTFGLMYAYSERFILPLSHDEIVYGKGSLLGKMPGDSWQRLASLRAYLAFMWTHPGKKLLFMGGEFAQFREWNHDTSLDWHLLDDPAHRGVQTLVRDLNRRYRSLPPLHALDCDPEGFRWVVCDDAERSVFAFIRMAASDGSDLPESALVVSNFTPVPRADYRIGVPSAGLWVERLNSDAKEYGGSGVGNDGAVLATDTPAHGQPASIVLTLPPLATIILTLDKSA